MKSDVMTIKEFADYLGVSVKTVHRWREACVGPPWIRLPGRAVRYRRDDVDAWLAANLHCPVRDAYAKEVVQDGR